MGTPLRDIMRAVLLCTCLTFSLVGCSSHPPSVTARRNALAEDPTPATADRSHSELHLRGNQLAWRPTVPLPLAGAMGSPLGCEHSRQGRHLVVDDTGFVCSRAAFNGTSGCCQESSPHDRFSCMSCDPERRCCSQYEYCVACCMDPDKTSLEEALSPIAHQPNAKPFTTVFELCQSRCRSNSGSVVHENAYKSDLHHCYSLGGAGENGSSIDGEHFKGEVSNPGESCQEACASRSMQCVSAALPLINTCDWLKQFFTCDGGCSVSSGADQPAEVIDDAPPDQRPGACLVNEKEETLSCEGRHPITRRLCPCAAVT